MAKTTELFKMRMTSTEKQNLIQDADDNDFRDTTKYVKYLIEKARGKKHTPPTSSNANLLKANSTSYHLSRIGNNINQMAYTVNKAHLENKLDGETAKEIAKELMYLNIQISNLNKK
jgi:hypothetical protein